MTDPTPPASPTPPGSGATTLPGPAAPAGELDPTIRDLLDRPVNDVLAALGLPPVPVPPTVPPGQELPPPPKGVPEAPQVPGFDVAGLVKPMTDLLSTFGSGSFSGLDPSAALEGASKALEQGMSAGMQAVSALGQVWQGPAATSAAGKGVQAATGTGLTAEQGAELSTAVSEAAAVVGSGEAELQAIIDSFMAVIAALGPSLWLPPGQAAAVAAAQEHTAHAMEVVARTKSELSGLTAQVSAAGRKVPVAPPPMAAAMTAAQIASSVAPAVLQAVTGAVTSVGKLATDTVGGAVKTAVQAASSAGEALGGMLEQQGESGKESGSAAADLGESSLLADGDTGLGLGAGVGGFGGGAQVGGLGGGAAGLGNVVAGAPLAPASPQSPAGGRQSVVDGGARTVPVSDLSSRSPMGGMMPLSGAGARPSATGDHAVPEYLVTGDNGDQMVGELPLVGPQVVGAADGAVAAHDEGLPDVELRL